MQSSRGSMDRVSDYGSEGWGFKSLRGRVFYKIKDECPIYENWRKNTIRRLKQGGFRISNKKNLEETLMNIFIKNDRNKMSMKNRKKLMISIVSDLYSEGKKGEKFKKRYKRFYKSYLFKRNRRKLRKSRVNFF